MYYYYCLYQNPPNFLVQAELSTYVTLAAIVLPDEDLPESNSMIGELVDLGIGNSVTSSETSQRSLSPDILAQRYIIIFYFSKVTNYKFN